MSELQLTDETFERDVLQSGKSFLVDLWAPWCGPCRAIAPIVDELAKDYEGKVLVGKLNTDDNPEVPAKLRVQAIPTLLFIKAGKIVETLVGARPKAEIKARLDALVAA